MDLEELLVDVSRSGIATLPFGPKPPVGKPGVERFGDPGLISELNTLTSDIGFVVFVCAGLLAVDRLSNRRLLSGALLPFTQAISSAGIFGGSSLATRSTVRRGASASSCAIRCADRIASWSGRAPSHMARSNLSTVRTGLSSSCWLRPRKVKRLIARRTRRSLSDSASTADGHSFFSR